MKKFALLLFALLWWGACKNEAVDYQLLDDESLAVAITSDRSKEAINPEEMPAEVLDFIESNHFDSYIKTSNMASEKGYEVTLATEERLYFNLRGKALQYRGGPTDGPCGRLGGELIPLDQLRPAIVAWVHEHYPDAQIRKAKQRGDKVIVLLGNQVILVFSADGVFEIDSLIWWDCLSCVPGNAVDIPQDVLDMIELRLPGAEIVRVCRRGGRIVIGVLHDEGRKILVFDRDWNFLFAHP